MNTTTKIAHDHALRGLMLLVVEVQNIIREASPREEHATAHDLFDRIDELVQSDHAAELIQLARAALETPAPTAATAAVEGPCDSPQPDLIIGQVCTRCCYEIRQHKPRAIPAAAASTHD